MSTSYTQVLHLPRSRQGGMIIGGLLAGALLVAAVTVTTLVVSGERGVERPWGPQVAFERVSGRGDMEFAGLEAREAPASGAGPHRFMTLRGGLAEYPGLEAPRAALGQAHGGLQQYPGTQ